MIYIDSSVVLAQLLLETRTPPDALWKDDLISSLLLTHEVWNRIHAFGLGRSHRAEVERLLEAIVFIELTPPALARSLDPFPVRVRTLDGLHLASMVFLQTQGRKIELASYDRRLNTAAQAMHIDLFPL